MTPVTLRSKIAKVALMILALRQRKRVRPEPRRPLLAEYLADFNAKKIYTLKP